MNAQDFLIKLHSQFPKFNFTSIRPAMDSDADTLFVVSNQVTNDLVTAFRLDFKSNLVYGYRFGNVDMNTLIKLDKAIVSLLGGSND